MSDTAANEALARRWHMEMFQEGKLDVADEILAPGFVWHMPDADVQGAEGTKELVTSFRTAFPDVAIAHEDTVAAGDKVAIRWTARATHQGEFQGVPATGKEIRMWGIDLFHLREGRIVEGWIDYDLLGVLRQMGAA